MQNNYFGRDLHMMRFAENYHRWIRDVFKPYLGEDVAEVGAGNGNFSKILLTVPIKNLWAFEPSDNMFPLLKETLQSDPRCRVFHDAFGCQPAGERFDSVVYVNVLEHIEHDLDELQRVYKALHHGGHVLIFVPAHQSLYSRFDRQLGHFRRYNRSSLIERVEKAGFHIVNTRYFDLPGALLWFVKLRLLKGSLDTASIRLYDTLAVCLIRLIETLIPPPMGKNLLLIGKKE